MGFMDSYKHLEKLCSDLFSGQHGVSSYIDAMTQNSNGAFYVAGWTNDLKALKHYRWIRNQIVHDPNCREDNMCEFDDTQWIDNFYDRIINQTDPLALYRKATAPRTTAKKRMENPLPVQQNLSFKQSPRPRHSLMAVLLFAMLILFSLVLFHSMH